MAARKPHHCLIVYSDVPHTKHTVSQVTSILFARVKPGRQPVRLNNYVRDKYALELSDMSHL